MVHSFFLEDKKYYGIKFCDVHDKWNKKKWISLLATQTPTLVIDRLKFCICYISELVQKLLGNTSIFYYDPELGVNVITWEPLLAGNK